mmetsp:Transcript_20985/g.35775  ORF Transcript_20985/g.35775 Transcript_20985/m.35775 type:complete len:127 (-) Transcript_20985:46-426(-)
MDHRSKPRRLSPKATQSSKEVRSSSSVKRCCCCCSSSSSSSSFESVMTYTANESVRVVHRDNDDDNNNNNNKDDDDDDYRSVKSTKSEEGDIDNHMTRLASTNESGLRWITITDREEWKVEFQPIE